MTTTPSQPANVGTGNAGPPVSVGMGSMGPPANVVTTVSQPVSAGTVVVGGTATTAATNTVVRPIMGGIETLGTQLVPWCGGKPLSDWSGLDVPPDIVQPTNYRPADATGASKQRYYRTAALKTTFKKGDDLQQFQKKVMERLVYYGMDPIAYLPDPADNTKMISVVNEHAKYRVEEAKVLADNLKTHWDAYDKRNDGDAKEVIRASISDELNTVLDQVSEEDDSFAIYWI
jgi:hypothetical protein